MSTSRPLETLELADFEPQIGTVFRIQLSDGALELELLEAAPHPHLPHAPGARRGFSLVFRSRLAGHLPQAIYRLEHDAMGTMDLFLVPIGPQGGGMRYEAVFN